MSFRVRPEIYNKFLKRMKSILKIVDPVSRPDFTDTIKIIDDMLNFTSSDSPCSSGSNNTAGNEPQLTQEELQQNFQIVKDFEKSQDFIEDHGWRSFLERCKNIFNLQLLQMLYNKKQSTHDYGVFESKLVQLLNQTAENRTEEFEESFEDSRDLSMMCLILEILESSSIQNNEQRDMGNETRREPAVKIVHDGNFKIFYMDLPVNETKSLYEAILSTYYFVVIYDLPYPMAKLFYVFDKLLTTNV